MKKYTIKSVIEAILTIGFGGALLMAGIIMVFDNIEYKSSGEIVNGKVISYESTTTTTKKGTFTNYSPVLEGNCKGTGFKSTLNEQISDPTDTKNEKTYEVYCINKSSGTFLKSINDVNNNNGAIFLSIVGIIIIWLGWIFRKSDIDEKSV